MSGINDQQVDYIDATRICFDLITRNGDVCCGIFGEYCHCLRYAHKIIGLLQTAIYIYKFYTKYPKCQCYRKKIIICIYVLFI